MKVDELEKQCREALERGGDTVVVVRCDNRTMLLGNRGPRGEILCENHKAGRVVRYNAKAVLAFIVREKRKAAAIKAAVNEVLK